ncbi:outer dense fiber protein 4 [Sorex fumeus]|uniref:outer dense fiber protein 4 n=1 Tax=Sorex fumeus TaxID=62283 RepID=UPI0024ADB93F|nr:outer dense fiber protein 4 [Sorex fumeus]
MNIRSLERQERAGKQTSVDKAKAEQEPSSAFHFRGKNRRVSVLPLKWRLRHSSRWAGQVLTSELSLLAFILLMVMVFSKKWLYPSRIRYYQPWHTRINNIIDNSAHILSMGLLQFDKSKSYNNSENGRVVFIFFTLIFFPVNLWIFELKMNVSIPIGWSYFIGWLVFILYATCGMLCYFSNRHFREVIQSPPSGIRFSNSHSSSVKDDTNRLFQIPVKKKEVRYPKKKLHHFHHRSTTTSIITSISTTSTTAFTTATATTSTSTTISTTNTSLPPLPLPKYYHHYQHQVHCF